MAALRNPNSDPVPLAMADMAPVSLWINIAGRLDRSYVIERGSVTRVACGA